MATLTGYAVKITALPFLDHTYVKSSDGYSWACWGREENGNSVCSGEGSSAIANCLSQPSSHTGISYGISGVCHQTANQILYPAGVIVSNARGYSMYRTLYGNYGTTEKEWRAVALPECLKSMCVKTAQKMEDKKTKILSNDIYKYGSPIGKEFELMIDHRLGNEFDPDKKKTIMELHSDLLKKKLELDHSIENKEFSDKDFTDEVNNLLSEVLKSKAEIMGAAEFEKLFGVKPGKKFMIVDPEIAFEVLKQL